MAPQAPRAIGRHQGFGRRGEPSAISLLIQRGAIKARKACHRWRLTALGS
jgi:hypothetical protein